MQCLVDRGERAVIAPALEIAVDGGMVGEVAREVAPGAGVLGLVEDGVEDAAAVCGGPASARPWWREQGGDDGPLLVGEVGRVGSAAHREAVKWTTSTLHS